MRRPQKVVVYEPKKRGNSSVLRWKVDGKEYSRSRPNKAQATKLQRELRNAADNGVWFDPATGEPESWAAGVSVLDYAADWYQRHWRDWKPKTREGHREVLPTVVLALTDKAVSAEDREVLVPWIREALCVKPGTDVSAVPEPRRAVRWLRQHSLPLRQLTVREIDAALDVFATKADGTEASSTYANRRRTTMSGILSSAVTDGHLDSSPLSKSRKRRKTKAKAVDARQVLTVGQAVAFLCIFATVSTTARRLVAPLATVLFSGCRPGEMSGLRASDCTLPETGWGELRFRSSLVDVGEAVTDDGDTQSEGALKWREEGTVRVVPIPQVLCAIIRTHQELYGPGPDGRVFVTDDGDLPPEHWGSPWAVARRRAGFTGPLASIVPYDLRHTAASMMLAAGVPIPEIARRMGHSPEMLLAVYANIMATDEEVANARIEAALEAAGLG